MSANLRLRISTVGEVTVVALAVAVATALGGCAMNDDQPGAGDTAMTPAGVCEQQHQAAEQECAQRFDSEANFDELQACRDQALEGLQTCRGG